jgi:stage V sporulation protein AE
MTGRIENKAYLGAVRQVQELKIWNNDRIGQEGIGQMDYVNAFWVGGLVCALVQILMEKTKMLPGRIMVLLVCTGAVLGALQLYEPFQEFAGAGASVPLLGFGNTLWKGVKEAVESDGFIGIFMGGFKASAVGISAALVFGYLASLIFQPKMKK